MNKLETLAEEKVLLVKQYVSLLDTIEVAFGHVRTSLQNLQYTEADRLLDDIVLAFRQISESNAVLGEFFSDHPGVTRGFADFEAVLDAAEQMEQAFIHDREKIIIERVWPAFSKWSSEIHADLISFYLN